MRSVAKWGAIIGVGTYIIVIALLYIERLIVGSAAVDPNHPASIALGCLQLLVIVFAFSAAGFYAGRDTGVAGLGALAGMLTCAIYGVLNTLIPLANNSASNTAKLPLGQQIIVSVASDALFLGIAALIGWLGGRPGASRHKAPVAPSAAPTNNTSNANKSNAQ